MKKATVTVTLILLGTLMGVAQTPQTFGAWSVYEAAGRGGEAVTLLQTSSLEHGEDAQGQPVMLKLDAVCRHGRLYRVALETALPVSTRAMNFSGGVPTTSVSFRADESSTEIQRWAVLDSGHTISPYSEILQGKKNHAWVERLAGTDTLVIEFQGTLEETPIHARFHTEGISKALASVGCTY